MTADELIGVASAAREIFDFSAGKETTLRLLATIDELRADVERVTKLRTDADRYEAAATSKLAKVQAVADRVRAAEAERDAARAWIKGLHHSAEITFDVHVAGVQAITRQRLAAEAERDAARAEVAALRRDQPISSALVDVVNQNTEVVALRAEVERLKTDLEARIETTNIRYWRGLFEQMKTERDAARVQLEMTERPPFTRRRLQAERDAARVFARKVEPKIHMLDALEEAWPSNVRGQMRVTIDLALKLIEDAKAGS